MKKISVFFLLVVSYLLLTANVAAQYGAPSPSYSIIVDKMVQKPGTADYVDNLSLSDPRYKPDNYVMFKVTIKNTSSTNLVGMAVKDSVPSYLTPIEGPGSFNESTREVEWSAGDFSINEQKTFYMKMQIASQSGLPADKGLFCVVNRVQADSSNAYDDDTSQLCIEKQVTGAAKVPAAGPEMGLLLLAGNLLGVGLGFKFRKTS